MRIRVYHEDTDAGGVVYYANYLRYFERSRTELIEGLGFSIRDYQNQGIWFTVVRVEASYRSPAVYGDTLEVITRVEQVKKVRFALSHEIRRQPTRDLIVEGLTVMACVDQTMKPQQLPADLSVALSAVIPE